MTIDFIPKYQSKYNKTNTDNENKPHFVSCIDTNALTMYKLERRIKLTKKPQRKTMKKLY